MRRFVRFAARGAAAAATARSSRAVDRAAVVSCGTITAAALLAAAPALCAPRAALTTFAKADAMFDCGERDALYALLLAESSPTTVNSAAHQWRLARAAYNVAETLADPARRKALHYEALAAARAALALDSGSYKAHSWVGIALSKVGEYEGDKATIQNSFVVRDHWLRAAELAPEVAWNHHMLGQWAYAIADLAGYKRVVASFVFATPPTASFEEALAHFVECERRDPGGTKANALMVAKSLRKVSSFDVPLIFCATSRY